VPEEKLGQAIGKQGAHSKKIGKALGKNVRIIGFNVDPVKFTRNLIYQAEPRSITLEKEDTEKHIIIEADYKTHCSIRGKKSKNLNILRKLLKRHHNVDEIILKQ
jgi:N utilization substance protein A